MNSGFYRAFEDRYRGSRELITKRLEAYLPFLEPLKALYDDYPVLDIGCGRGEWLELLLREGYAPVGVDLDEGMLEACQALQLPAHKDDALSALRALPDNSQVAISGFHIAEHVPFPVLQELVAEALRVLRPAGLLILETPNAENVMVGTNNFYLDPTHEQPLPNLLLSFLAEYTGFARAKVVRLQEAAQLRDDNAKLGVHDVLFGVSQDYAVVAQKQADRAQLEGFEAPFAAAYGVSLDQLAQRYDNALEKRLEQLEDKIESGRAAYFTSDEFGEVMAGIQRQQTEQLLALQERYGAAMEALQRQCGALQESLAHAQAKADALQLEYNASLENAHHWSLRAHGFEQQLHTLVSSTSWRMTKPLRQFSQLLRGGKGTVYQTMRRAAPHARLWLNRRPALQRLALAVLRRSPWLAGKVRNLLATPVVVCDPQHGVIDHAPLTPRGRAIESALREAIMKGQN